MQTLLGFYPTYEELKPFYILISCYRLHSFYPTYEELKQIKIEYAKWNDSRFLPYL